MLPLQGTIAYPLPLVDNFPNFPALVGYVSSKNSLEGTVPLDVSRRDFTFSRSSFSQVNQPFQLSGAFPL